MSKTNDNVFSKIPRHRAYRTMFFFFCKSLRHSRWDDGRWPSLPTHFFPSRKILNCAQLTRLIVTFAEHVWARQRLKLKTEVKGTALSFHSQKKPARACIAYFIRVLLSIVSTLVLGQLRLPHVAPFCHPDANNSGPPLTLSMRQVATESGHETHSNRPQSAILFPRETVLQRPTVSRIVAGCARHLLCTMRHARSAVWKV